MGEETEEDDSIQEEEEEEDVKPKCWSSNAGLAPLMNFWERRGAGGAGVTKYASESHLADGKTGGVPENGLRKQVRDRDYTSGEEEEWRDSEGEEGEEEHIYAMIEEKPRVVEESGFFSYEESRREERLVEGEDEFFLVGEIRNPRHVQRMSVVQGEEEREEEIEASYVTRIEVEAYRPSQESKAMFGEGLLERAEDEVEKIRRMMQLEEKMRRRREAEEELRRIQQQQYEDEKRREREAEQRRKQEVEQRRRQEQEEWRLRKPEEEREVCPRQSVSDLRALYERVGTLIILASNQCTMSSIPVFLTLLY